MRLQICVAAWQQFVLTDASLLLASAAMSL
jgi:hypothetical protein